MKRSHGGIVNPPCNRKGKNGNPSPTGWRARGLSQQRRGTEVPTDTPLALTEEFSRDAQKAKQWQAFVRKSNLDHDGVTLDTVVADLAEFLLLPLKAIGTSQKFPMVWRNNGPWSPTTPHI